MVDGGIRHQTDSVHIDPLPEGDFLRHRVGLHLALHLNVEDLEGAASYENKFGEKKNEFH